MAARVPPEQRYVECMRLLEKAENRGIPAIVLMGVIGVTGLRRMTQATQPRPRLLLRRDVPAIDKRELVSSDDFGG